MLINFCDPRLLPKISCDKISSDGYSVENLVSADSKRRSLGFLAEYFIKPPVAITIAFPTNIEIYQIHINPVVGSQKSTSFEIYTLSEKVHNSWISCNDTSASTNTNMSKSKVTSQLFTPVGKGSLGEPGIVFFHNISYIINPLDKLESLPAKYTFDLRHHKACSLNYVSHLKIRVTRTTSGKTVAMKSIAVWGRPARLAVAKQVHRIHELWTPQTEATDNIAVSSEIKAESDSCHKNRIRSEVFTENGIEIPEDFIDPLTYEIMSMPMLLPSGKSIDQSTLDKHIHAGSLRGRLPSDPFTGVVFDDKCRPLPNVHLKARLDRFILANSAALSHIPKSLGRSDINYDKTNPNVSRLLEQKHTEETGTLNSIQFYSNKEENLVFNSGKQFISHKIPRWKQSSKHMLSVSTKRKAADLDSSKTISQEFQIKRRNTTPQDSLHLSTSSHENNLQSSLNSALHSTLSCLPTFIKTSQTSNVSDCVELKNVCIRCKSCETLYRAPCNHLFCRNCLTSTDQISDGVFDMKCSRTWDKHDFTRVHREIIH